MADICRTCGIRLDMDGLCRCPEVLLAEIERLRAECKRLALSVTGIVTDFKAVAGEAGRRLTEANVATGLLTAEIRSLRAKLMRERAERHIEEADHERAISRAEVGYGVVLSGKHAERMAALLARARRLRAEAERVEGGGR